VPIKVGITGGIGVGKSVVARIFAVLGVPIYDSDSRAKLLMEQNAELVKAICSSFGKESYIDGMLNRRFLADQVFNDESKIKILNSLVHPAVGKDFATWTARHTQHTYVIKEAALLIESGSYKELDELILVDAPIETRIERVLKRDHQRSRKEILSIMAKQMSTEEKKGYITYEIQNDGTRSLISRVVGLHKELLTKTYA
jgi:dephospho-CoA kinase